MAPSTRHSQKQYIEIDEEDGGSEVELLALPKTHEPNPYTRDLVTSATDEGDDDKCRLCSISFKGFSLSEKEVHYEQMHPDPGEVSKPSQPRLRSASKPSSSLKPSVSSPRTSTNTKPLSSASSSSLSSKRSQPFWHVGKDGPPPPLYTPGVIPLLKTLLTKSHSSTGGKASTNSTARAVLCHESVVHIQKDKGTSWQCGYRNFTMACTALIAQKIQPYSQLFREHSEPTIQGLQETIESAWIAGFDSDGAAELNQTLMNTQKWIGVVDIWVAFTFMNIPARLVDFKLQKRPPADRQKVVVDWVVQYFKTPNTVTKSPAPSSKASKNAFEKLQAGPVVMTDKMPLILQWSGHSQLVVGYEVLKDGTAHLLVFDTMRRLDQAIQKEAAGKFGLELPTADVAEDEDEEEGKTSRSTAVAAKRPGKRTDTRRGNSPRRKKARTSLDGANDKREPQVIVVESDEDDNVKVVDEQLEKPIQFKSSSTSNIQKALQPFRGSSKPWASKDVFQILYFPLDPPLTWIEHDALRDNIPFTRVE